MKNTILKYGLLSGGVSALLMTATIPFVDQIGFEYGTIIGYTEMVISFLFVYFGIRSYRDTVLDGRIGFFRAVGVGLLITLISCVCYVIAWEIIFYNVMPDFADRYIGYLVEQLQAKGAPQSEIDGILRQGDQWKTLYANPLTMAAITILEPLPVGVLITFVSAAVLRRGQYQAAEAA